MIRFVPLLQFNSNVRRSHAFPVKPLAQRQSPVSLTHFPLFEHSTSSCALSSTIAGICHAVPFGHCTFFEGGGGGQDMCRVVEEKKAEGFICLPKEQTGQIK
jgi:hypothetical protein